MLQQSFLSWPPALPTLFYSLQSCERNPTQQESPGLLMGMPWVYNTCIRKGERRKGRWGGGEEGATVGQVSRGAGGRAGGRAGQAGLGN